MSDTDTAAKAQTELRSAVSVLVERMLFAQQAGISFNGARNLWAVLGYDAVISYDKYRGRFDRGGIAGRVVDAKPTAVWRGDGDIIEDKKPDITTDFEAAWDELNEQLKVWSTLQRAHILANIGSFSVLLLGAEGDLEAPLPKGKPGGLFYATPFGGGVVDNTIQRGMSPSIGLGADVTVQTWEEDIKNPRFGQPKTYQLKRTNMTSPGLQRPVHWTRVIHIPAEGFIDDAIFGPPALQRVWNYLDDLDKVVGGGAEAFWLRANAGTQIDIDKDMQLPPTPEELTELARQAEEYKHQITRMIRTRGVNINQLGSDVADFKGPADCIITLIAGTCGIPKRILTGSEMGELASSQDRDNWNDQVKDCRTNYAHPIILRPFIERLIEFGYLPKPKQWEPQWPNVAALNEIQKLTAAGLAMALNDHGETVVTGDEVRQTYLERDPLTDEQKSEIEDRQQQQMEQTSTNVQQLEAALRKGGTLSLAVRP